MEQNWGPRRDVPWNTISYCQPVAVGRCVKELYDLEEHRISGRILSGGISFENKRHLRVQRAARCSMEQIFPRGAISSRARRRQSRLPHDLRPGRDLFSARIKLPWFGRPEHDRYPDGLRSCSTAWLGKVRTPLQASERLAHDPPTTLGKRDPATREMLFSFAIKGIFRGKLPARAASAGEGPA